MGSARAGTRTIRERPLGEARIVGGECRSGHCVDGVCCDVATCGAGVCRDVATCEAGEVCSIAAGGGVDAGALPDAGGRPLPAEGGCGCRVPGRRTGGMPAALPALATLAIGVIVMRRRTR
jgi:hypothetical protein